MSFNDHLAELEILDDGLDLLGLAVLQVEDGALPARAASSSPSTSASTSSSTCTSARGGRRPGDLAEVGHGEVAPRGRPPAPTDGLVFPAQGGLGLLFCGGGGEVQWGTMRAFVQWGNILA